MFATTAVILVSLLEGQFEFGQPLPIYEEHLKAPSGQRRVSLVMDVSGSMDWGEKDHPDCLYAQSVFGTTLLDKNQQMIASAIGCQTANDGFLDIWEGQIDFAVTGFGYSAAGSGSTPYVQLVQNFTRNKALLETAIRSLPADGGTPLEPGLYEGLYQHQRYWTNSVPGTAACDEHYNIVMTDGVPNMGGRADYAWAPCSSPSSLPPNVDRPDLVAKYGYGTSTTHDAVCGLSGNQRVVTFAIGFGEPGDLDEALLQNVADAGGGVYLHASDAYQLAAQFGKVLNAIASRTARFTAPAFQSNGLQSGNLAYVANVLPIGSGPWVGNVKGYCIYPPKHTNGSYYLDSEIGGSNCLFKFHDADGPGPAEPYPIVNGAPVDRFSGSSSRDTTVGGAGARFFVNTPRPGQFGGGAPDSPINISNHFFKRRRILTWANTSSGYMDVADLTDVQMFAAGCARTRLLAYLHGFDPVSVDCDTGKPTKYAKWPLGTATGTRPVILRWGADCEATRDACLVAANMDDGGVHFFDASDGFEHSVLIPKQLFQPGSVGNYPIASIAEQPTAELTRKPYNNGGMIRLHDDRNGNGIIDNSEAAYLIWGLGHGGAAYYMMDVSRPFTSQSGPSGLSSLVPTSQNNPTYTILATNASVWARDLRDTHAAPWLGRVQFAANAAPEIGLAFPSGHVWYADRPDESMSATGTPLAGLRPAFDASGARTITCRDFATANGYPPNAVNAFCTAFSTANYQNLNGGAAGDYVVGTPLWYTSGSGPGAWPAGAIGQFDFSQFNLDAGDYFVVEDLLGNEISARYTGNLTPSGAHFIMPLWVTTRPFTFRVHVNGGYNPGAPGFRLDSMQWIPDRTLGGCIGGNPCEPCDRAGAEDGQCTGVVGECNATSSWPIKMTCRLCDLNKDGSCSGPSECGVPSSEDGTSCVRDHSPFVALLSLGSYVAQGAFTDTTSNSVVKRIFTRTCRGSYPANTCYDSSIYSDLQYMKCPINAELRAYKEGDIARAFYVGDQCGQMWKFWTDDGGGVYKAKRLFVVNNLAVANSESRDFRRFERPVDIVLSTCTGGRAVGIYFGTGNQARVGVTDNLEGPTGSLVSAYTENAGRGQVSRRDIAGVFFDKGQWDTGTSRTLVNFQNLTPPDFGASTVPAFTTSNNGWFFAFRDDEQMIRDPLVFDGVFYVKTNTTITAAQSCQVGTTTDRVYALNNCKGIGAVDVNSNNNAESSERVVYTGSEDVGGNIIAYAPPDGRAPLVTTGGGAPDSIANLAPVDPTRRALKMYMWWRSR